MRKVCGFQVQRHQFRLIIESAGKLVVEPPVMVSRGLCSAACHDTFCDSLFAVLELSPVKPWLVDSLFCV